MTSTLSRPAPPARRLPTALVWAATAWLLALGATAIVVGGHDLLVATEITVRLWGTLVLGAGVVLLAGAWGLHTDTESARALAMVASLLGVALGAMTFLAQVVSDEPDVRLLAWAAIIAVSGGCAWLVYALTPEDERGAGMLARLPVLKSVVSVGVLISLVQFWYTAIYIPTTAPANLTLEPKLTQVPQRDRVVLQGTVTIRNTSGTRVNVLASYLDVSGSNDGMTGDDDARYREAVVAGHMNSQPTAERWVENGSPASVLHESPVRDGTYFEPGETITVSYLTWVPKGLYTRATVDVYLTIARARSLALEDAAPKVTPHDGATVSMTEIPESGWLRSLTRGDRFVRVSYDDGALETYPDVRLAPAPDDTPDDFDRRMWRLYGISRVQASTDVSIPASA